MSNYEFICDLTGAIYTVVWSHDPAMHFTYCPSCGLCQAEPWKGFQNIEGLTASEVWAENHRWEEV